MRWNVMKSQLNFILYMKETYTTPRPDGGMAMGHRIISHSGRFRRRVPTTARIVIQSICPDSRAEFYKCPGDGKREIEPPVTAECTGTAPGLIRDGHNKTILHVILDAKKSERNTPFEYESVANVAIH